MTEMEGLSASEGQADVEAVASCVSLTNRSEAGMTVVERPSTPNNVESNVTSPAKCTNQQTNKEESSQGDTTSPSDHVAEAQLNSEAEPVHCTLPSNQVAEAQLKSEAEPVHCTLPRDQVAEAQLNSEAEPVRCTLPSSQVADTQLNSEAEPVHCTLPSDQIAEAQLNSRAEPVHCTSPGDQVAEAQLNSEAEPVHRTSASDQVAEAVLNSEAGPVQIKQEIEANYSEDDVLTNEEALLEEYPIKDKQDVKRESDLYTDESECDDEPSACDNFATPGTVSSTGNDGNNLNVSSGGDETVTSNQGGDTSAEVEDVPAANGGSPAVRRKHGHDGNSSTLDSEVLVIPRKRRKIAATESLAVDLTSPRQKRSAFKKCTEWFKLFTGELQEKFSCPSCNQMFSSQRKLKDHIVTHKYGKSSKANEKVTKSKKKVVESNQKVVKSNEEVAESNEEVGESNEEVAESDESAIKVMTELLGSQNGVLRCGECLEVFSTRSGLSRHQRRHGVPRYNRNKCHTKFLSRKSWVAHKHILSGNGDLFHGKVTTLRTPVSRIRKLKCDQCDARFAQQWSLEQHLVVHSLPAQELECKECGDKLSDVSLLAKHQESHSGHRSKAYGCGECDSRFTDKSALFKHQLSHVEPRKSECPECQEVFAERSELKIHRLTVHGTENLCVCTECNKSFSNQAALKRHLGTHNEGNRFTCSVCKEIFAQKSTLTRHALLHGGEQFYRFTCSVCDRKFSRRDTLNDHMRIHTGERPFVCAVCHEGFTQKSAMKRHQILHFKERKRRSSLAGVEVDAGMTEDILLSLVYDDS